jgi:hypothetical protein
MNKSITFCIATAKDEKEYVDLLVKSLQKNTEFESHEILIFIDSDNQDTFEFLTDKKKNLKNLRICKNESEFPIGGQTNISLMFKHASNDIVCYLQSDMVVGRELDKHILLNLTDKSEILSLTRIEPPLHPESETTITKDFGMSPLEFDEIAFDEFVKIRQEYDSGILNDVYFAPFAVFKETWFDVLGGFDTQFRCSREDSDILVRSKLARLTLKQSWNAMVYHFTCVSSRGKDWFKTNMDSKYKNELQQKADTQELIRFTRKWGRFSHDINYMYNISIGIDLDQYSDINVLMNIEPYFSKIYLNNSNIQKYLISTLDFTYSYVSNLRWNYTEEYWNAVKSRFKPLDFNTKIEYTPNIKTLSNDYNKSSSNDVLVLVQYSDISKNINDSLNIIQSLQDIVHQNDLGLYEYGHFIININKKYNNVYDKIKAHIIDDSTTDSFKFI